MLNISLSWSCSSVVSWFQHSITSLCHLKTF